MIVRFQKISSNLPKMIVHFMNDRSFSKKISTNLPKMIVHFINDCSFYEWSSVFKKYRSIYLKWASILLMTWIGRREKSFFISKLFFVSCWFRSWVMSFRSCHDTFPTLTWLQHFFWNFQSGLQQNFSIGLV